MAGGTPLSGTVLRHLKRLRVVICPAILPLVEKGDDYTASTSGARANLTGSGQVPPVIGQTVDSTLTMLDRARLARRVSPSIRGATV